MQKIKFIPTFDFETYQTPCFLSLWACPTTPKWNDQANFYFCGSQRKHKKLCSSTHSRDKAQSLFAITWGMPRMPDYTHLKRLHWFIASIDM